MKRTNRRPLTLTGLLIAVALCLGLAPRPTSAVRLTLTLADNNASYGTGRFFRTGLTRDQPLGPGGVQLVPTKLQSSWVNAADLPSALSSHTSAVYRDRIFVVGGKTLTGNETTPIAKSAKFYSTKLANPDTGTLRPWTDQPVLPALPIAVTDAASTIVTVGGQPFLFVLGGQRQVGGQLDDVTTSRIFYYPIAEDANGNLVVQSGWREIAPAQSLPHTPAFGETNGTTRGGGASGLGVTSVTVGGTPYIYVFGGFNRVYSTANGYENRYVSDVWRASVTGSDTTLALDWNLGAENEPFSRLGVNGSRPSGVPLAGMSTVTYTHPDTGDVGVYLIGGTRCTADCQTNAATTQPDEKAYVARIGTDGSLTWLLDGNMSEGRTAHDAIQAQGQVLLLAGRANGSPSVSGANGFVGAYDDGGPRTIDDDLELYRDPTMPTAPNFDLVTGFFGNAKPRMNHTMETLAGTADNQWAYVIGGQVEVQQGLIEQASSEVWVGNLKTPPIPTDNVVSDGKYYSKTYDFGPDATFFNLFPTFQFKRDETNAIVSGQRVEVQYRIGDTEASMGAWSSVIPANDGRNTITLPANTTGRYFQYMVSLYRSSTNAQAAPILDKVELDVNRNGFPNILMSAQNPFQIGSVNLPDPVIAQVAIANQATSPTIPALNANWDAEGSFYVLMYRLGPGQAKPRADWPSFGDPGIAFAEVGKSSLPANAQFNIPPSTWRQWCATPPSCPAVNDGYWRAIFNSIGDHSVYIMVDANGEPGSFGDVKEADDITSGGEIDNVGGPYLVRVNVAGSKVFAPLIFRQGTGATAAELGAMPWPHFIK